MKYYDALLLAPLPSMKSSHRRVCCMSMWRGRARLCFRTAGHVLFGPNVCQSSTCLGISRWCHGCLRGVANKGPAASECSVPVPGDSRLCTHATVSSDGLFKASFIALFWTWLRAVLYCIVAIWPRPSEALPRAQTSTNPLPLTWPRQHIEASLNPSPRSPRSSFRYPTDFRDARWTLCDQLPHVPTTLL